MRRQLDLALVAGLATAGPLILVTGDRIAPLRAAVGLLLVLFLPGYALGAALGPRSLDRAERALLSLGLSLAVTVVAGIALNQTHWGLHRTPWSMLLAGITVVGCAGAAVRRSLATAPSTGGAPAEAFRDHFRSPLYRSGYALMANQVASAALGVAYWVVAVRLYPASVVGRNASLIATLILVAAISQLSLKQALTRFVPRTGPRTARLVALSYVVTVGVGIVAGAIFLLVARHVGQADLTHNSFLAGWLVISIIAWAIFDMQDGVLTGMRRAGFVLVENGAYNLAKIALLIPMSHLSPKYGVLLSWTLPVPFLVLAVNAVIFGRLIPRHKAVMPESALPRRTVIRSVGSDYLGTMLAEAGVRLLPLLVIMRLGDAANAYFYQAWLIATTFSLVAGSMGGSFTVEAAADPAQVAALSRRTLVHLGRLLVPAAVVCFVAAPSILRVFGTVYAEQATGLLRWLLAGTLPMIAAMWFLSYARVANRFGTMVVIPGIGAALMLGLTYELLPHYGIAGAGIAWFVSQVVLAAISAVAGRRVLFGGAPSGERWQPHLRFLSAAEEWLAAGRQLSLQLSVEPPGPNHSPTVQRCLDRLCDAAGEIQDIGRELEAAGSAEVRVASARARAVTARLLAAQADMDLRGRARTRLLAPLAHEHAEALGAFVQAARQEAVPPAVRRAGRERPRPAVGTAG